MVSERSLNARGQSTIDHKLDRVASRQAVRRVGDGERAELERRTVIGDNCNTPIALITTRSRVGS